MAYLEGVKTGYATGGGNPFSVVIGRVKEVQARKLAEQKKDKDELRELEQVFKTLAKKHEYDTQMEKQKHELSLELEREKAIEERKTKMLEGYEIDESGSEVDPGAQQVTQQQPVDRNQRLLQMTGLAMPSKPVNRVGEMAPVAEKQSKKSSSKTLPETFGLGKGTKVKEKTTLDTRKKELEIRKLEEELKGSEDLKQRQSEEFLNIADDTLNTIAEVEKGREYFGLRSYQPAIPGTKKVGWDANINKLLAGRILETIADMKRTSKTGATGFGQLNRAELKVLTDASTALKKTMSKEDAQPYLDKMKEAMIKIRDREQGSQVQGKKTLSPEERAALIQKIKAKNASR